MSLSLYLWSIFVALVVDFLFLPPLLMAIDKAESKKITEQSELENKHVNNVELDSGQVVN